MAVDLQCPQKAEIEASIEADDATTTPSSGVSAKPSESDFASEDGGADRPGGVDFLRWPSVVDACTHHFQQVNRLPIDAVKALREDSRSALPCLLLEPRANKHHNIEFVVVFATRSMGETVGRSCSTLTGSAGLSFLQAQPPAIDMVLNGKAWSQLAKFQGEFQRCSGASLPGPTRVLILCPSAAGTPCWSLMECLPVKVSVESDHKGRYILYVLHPLEAPVPKALWGPGALAYEEVIKLSVSRLRTNINMKQFKGNDPCGPIAEVAEQTTAILQDVLKDCQVGDNFVPRLSHEAAKAFQSHRTWYNMVEKVKDQLEQLFEMTPAEVQSLADDRDGKSSTFACAVAKVNEAECSLVHVSRGFAKLTGFSKDWAIGRNCRFMQPHDAQKNQAFNSTQLRRMKQFCQKLRGRLLTVLLQETSDGAPYWSLLYMDHVQMESTSYIFSVQTCLASEHNIMERIVGHAWSERGVAALEGLRAILARKEGALIQRRPMRRIAVEAFQEWLAEAASDVKGWWHGGLFIPQVGEFAVNEFAKLCPDVTREVPREVQELLQQHSGAGKRRRGADEVCYAISDPRSVDCTMVYVSPGFEVCTGFRADFALGRNCRFLQPSLKTLNDAFNTEELQHIAKFFQQEKGERSTFTLLLNERRNGERWWNLLYLRHLDIKGQWYVLGLQTRLGVSMPSLLESHEASAAVLDFDGQGLAAFVEQLGHRLSALRSELHKGFGDRIADAEAKATTSLVTWMKSCCDEYEGDHRVPRMGGRELEIFESDERWRSILDAMEGSIMEVCGVDVANGQTSSWNVACAVADASTSDAPLIFISKEFEVLTGYPREWVIGRNCRFLQPNDASVNTALNKGELQALRNWVQQRNERSRIITLLVNEAHDEYPFWNLLFMEFLQVDGRPYIFAIQTSLDFELGGLAELFGMDDLGLRELARLRKALSGLESIMTGKKLPLRDAARECVGQWVKGLPPVMRVPKLPNSDCPIVSLELGGRTDFLPAISEALREGARHFHVTFHGCDRPQNDERMAELEGRLRALRLAEALNDLKKCHLHYLRSAVFFTLVTPPLLISAFSEFSKAITSSGYVFDSWLLDVRGVALAKVQECWRAMSQAKRSREVNKIGLWGATRQVLEALHEDMQLERPSVCAVETFPGKEGDIMHHNHMDYIRKLGITVLAYHVYGPKNCMLESNFVQAEALRLGVDSSILTMKWAEAKGFGVVVPRLRPGPAVEQVAEADQGQVRRCSTGAVPSGEPASSSGVAAGGCEEPRGVQGKVGMHRSFNRDFLRAPAAERCAVVMEAAANAQARDRPVWHSQTPRSGSKAHALQRRATVDVDASPTATAVLAVRNMLQDQASTPPATASPSSARRHTLNGNLVVGSSSDMPVRAGTEKPSPRLPEGELPQIKVPLRRRSTAATLNDLDEVEDGPPLPSSSRGGQFRRPSRTATRNSLRAEDLRAVTPNVQGGIAPARSPTKGSTPTPQPPPGPSPTRATAPPSPLQPKPSPPPTPQQPPQPRAPADAAAAPGTEGLLGGQLPGGLEMLQRAGVKLQSQGWSLQDIAGLFELPPQIVAMALASGQKSIP